MTRRSRLNPYATSKDVVGRIGGNGKTGLYVPQDWGINWASKLAAAKAGSGLAKVGVRGDSISFGYYTSNPLTKSFPGLLAANLQAAYADGGSGFNGAYHTSTILTDAGVASNVVTAWTTAAALWAKTGTWTTAALSVGPGGVALQSTVAASSVTIPFRGTSLKIYTLVNGAADTATFTYAIDGGSATTITDASSGGVKTVRVTTVTGLSAGTHSVVITKGSGSAVLYLIGIEGSNATGVLVNNFAAPGATGSYDFPIVMNGGTASAPSVPGLWSGGSSNACDLFIYAFGANECNRTLSANSTLSANVSALTSDFTTSVPLSVDRYMIDSETFWIKRGPTGATAPFSQTVYPDLLQSSHSSGATVKLPLARTEDWVRNLTDSFLDVRESNPAAELVILLPHIGTFDAWKQFNELAYAARGIAEEYGAALVDMWAIGRNSWNYWNGLGYWGNGASSSPGGAGTDSIHPSDAGQQAYHDALAPILKGQYVA